MSEIARRNLVNLIEDLNMKKDYKEETLYVAQSIADRYLVNITVNKHLPLPCFMTLALVSTLLSAKLNESIQPSFKRMSTLAFDSWNVTVDNASLLKLE